MKSSKIGFINKKWYSLLATSALLFLIAGCQQKKTKENTKTDSEEVNKEIIDDRYFGGCGRFRNTDGDKAYMSVTHTEGEKKLKGICFGRDVNQPIWTGEFTGKVVSSDTSLFEIDVTYQINGEAVKVKEKWEIVNNITFELVEAGPNRPELATEYLLVNCMREFPRQEGFIERNSIDYSYIKATKKYYHAIDLNGAVILELEYYEGIPEVTGTILGKYGENESWTGSVTGNLIDGKTDSLRITVLYFEGGSDYYYESSQTWYINEFSSLKIDPNNRADLLGGYIYTPIDLPNGFPDEATFEKNYMDYHNEID